jgi:hypothetical protein
MYHLELRQFPHNFCRFNLTAEELRGTVLVAWAREEWVDVGERKWHPQQATLTVLDGPELKMGQLAMGRGWRNAIRQGRDVTEELLAGARSEQQPGPSPGGSPAAGGAPPEAAAGAGGQDARLAGDSLGLAVLARLEDEPVPVSLAWRLARERYPERSAGDCLQLAELAVGSLLKAGLIALHERQGAGSSALPDGQGEPGLFEIDSWGSEGSLLMQRR